MPPGRSGASSWPRTADIAAWREAAAESARAIRDPAARDEAIEASAAEFSPRKLPPAESAAAAIEAALHEARTMDWPNFHHVARDLADAVEALVEAGDADAARTALDRATTAVGSWHIAAAPWVQSAVFRAMARASLRIDSGAARGHLRRAHEAARAEPDPLARSAAFAALAVAYARAGRMREAMEAAGRVPGARERRQITAQVLAVGGRFGVLAKVLDGVRGRAEVSGLATAVARVLAGVVEDEDD